MSELLRTMTEGERLRHRLNCNGGDTSIPTRALIGEAYFEILRLDALLADAEARIGILGGESVKLAQLLAEARVEGGARDQPLKIEVTPERLVVSIGIGTLAFAADELAKEEGAQRAEGDYTAPPTYKVTDPVEWAKEVSGAMQDEREDGATPLGDFIDAMFQKALDAGSVAVEHFELDSPPATGDGQK